MITPLREFLETYRQRELATREPAGLGVQYIPYGVTDERPRGVCELVASVGEVETEYAALRRGCGVLDGPHRATLEVTGADRVDFLDRMLTAAIKDLAPGLVRSAFLLSRKGRIQADLLLVDVGDRTLVDVDACQAAGVVEALESFVFTEDVQIADISERVHRLMLHGPRTEPVLDPDTAATATIADVEIVAARHDQIGDPGVHLFVPKDAAPAIAETLVSGDDRRTRPVGWFAFNTARIEAGTPLFNVDFGAESLPHETGVLESRVSFEKGCYPGQEVVARMHNLGQPKQQRRGLRIDGDTLPVAGDQLFAADEDEKPIGGVTSSTASPMLGSASIAFAMLRSTHADEATSVRIGIGDERVPATVVPLQHWRR
jgi:folate-binding protein YgfZ